ncbi:hypothetical protein SDC9_122820 [bioreactor metagenome]|uniref:Uncharacterized protein n=1 Tax=bioreactor metagenome TaxID=1076179 RepID=A0A645CFQ5_9ZZZZ
MPIALLPGAYAHSTGQCAITVNSPTMGQVMQSSVCSPAGGLDLNLERRTPLLVITAPSTGALTLDFTTGVRSIGLFAALLAPVGTPYEATLGVRLAGEPDFVDMPPVAGMSDHVCLPGDSTTAAFLSAGVDAGERIEAIRVQLNCDEPSGKLAIGWLYHWMN